ncbi:MAG: hypothetical protein V1722_05825 [Candidatus Micrarchaeota archaeon]
MAASGSSDSNTYGALAYVLFTLTGIAVLLMKPEDKYAKFHAWQSIILGIVLFVIGILLGIISSVLGLAIPIVGTIISILVSGVWILIELVIWAFCIWKAYSGEKFKLPVIGNFAEEQANK